MKTYTGQALREMYLNFFKEKGSLQWRSSGEIRIRREEASALYKFGDL